MTAPLLAWLLLRQQQALALQHTSCLPSWYVRNLRSLLYLGSSSQCRVVQRKLAPKKRSKTTTKSIPVTKQVLINVLEDSAKNIKESAVSWFVSNFSSP